MIIFISIALRNFHRPHFLFFESMRYIEFGQGQSHCCMVTSRHLHDERRKKKRHEKRYNKKASEKTDCFSLATSRLPIFSFFLSFFFADVETILSLAAATIGDKSFTLYYFFVCWPTKPIPCVHFARCIACVSFTNLCLPVSVGSTQTHGTENGIKLNAIDGKKSVASYNLYTLFLAINICKCHKPHQPVSDHYSNTLTHTVRASRAYMQANRVRTNIQIPKRTDYAINTHRSHEHQHTATTCVSCEIQLYDDKLWIMAYG